ncbi:MAG: hypothetical protein R3F11_23755 [Verrucomicrobiales bacterium]
MNLYISDDPAELAAVLYHETTHVYIEAGSESEFSDKFGSTRWFHEGAVSYVEFRFFRPPEALPRLRRVAAAAYDKKIVRLEQLINNADWSADHDPHLVYALGEVFCAALVARYGDEAPGRVVRAFARDGAPDLAGVRLWQDAMQSCGYSLRCRIRILCLAQGGSRGVSRAARQPAAPHRPRLSRRVLGGRPAARQRWRSARPARRLGAARPLPDE